MAENKQSRTLGVILFEGFELLDVFGPLEAFGILQGMFNIVMVAEKRGPIASAQGPKVAIDHTFDDCPHLDLMLIPGGIGTRAEIENPRMLSWLRERAAKAEITTSVCTGSGVLARAGILDGRPATSNKMFFKWVTDQGPKTKWVPEARWVDDGNVVTSSGVSAGIDMALHVIARLHGEEMANMVARGMEYEWHRDAAWDPFAKIHGLV